MYRKQVPEAPVLASCITLPPEDLLVLEFIPTAAPVVLRQAVKAAFGGQCMGSSSGEYSTVDYCSKSFRAFPQVN